MLHACGWITGAGGERDCIERKGWAGIGSGWFVVVGALTRSTGWRRQRLGLCSSGRRTLSLEMRPSSDVVHPIVMKLVVALISLVRGLGSELGIWCRASRPSCESDDTEVIYGG